MPPAEPVEGGALVEYVKNLAIATQEQNVLAGMRLCQIKKLQKKIKEDCKESISLAHKAHKEAKALQDKHLKPLEEAEALIKGALAGFNAEEQAEGIAVQRTWKARIVDESKLPEEYWGKVPNQEKLDAHAKFNRDSEIPGVEFYEDITIRATAK